MLIRLLILKTKTAVKSSAIFQRLFKNLTIEKNLERVKVSF